MSRKNGTTKIDIAVLKEQYKFIIEKLNKIDTKIDNVQLCANSHDTRLNELENSGSQKARETEKYAETLDKRVQRLEDWETSKKEQNDWNIKKIGIMMSIISLITSSIFWMINHFLGS